MKTYFLRHGIAVERDAWTGEEAERPLTDEGIHKTAAVAAALARLDLGLNAIVTSPLARARHTAEIAADALSLRSYLIEDVRLAPGFNRAKLRAVLQDHRDAAALMLVGHEPDFSETLSEIIGGGRLKMRKAGVALVDLPEADAKRGRLLWLATPRLLTRLAGPPASVG
jgi:phosphohistidine phosphatase